MTAGALQAWPMASSSRLCTLHRTTAASNTTRRTAGPADTDVTGWIEARANELLKSGLRGVKRMPFEKALHAATTHRHDYLNAYVSDLQCDRHGRHPIEQPTPKASVTRWKTAD